MNATISESRPSSEKLLSKISTKPPAMNVLIRSYRRGDEVQIVHLLNICFGNWGSSQKWGAQYLRNPNFDERDLFIIEKDGKIIGHEALHFRDLAIDGKSAISTVSLRDAAVDPEYRGHGLHSKLLDTMLHEAKERGAALIFSWYLRDSGLHQHSKRIGFTEIKQPVAYMKVIAPEKLLRSGLCDFLHKSPALEEKINELGWDLHFRLGRTTFSYADLLEKRDQSEALSKDRIEVIFDENSLPSLIRFRNMTKRQRLLSLVSLIIFRRVKIKLGSFAEFVKLARKGLSVIASV